MATLALAQETCQETRDLRNKLDAQNVLIGGHQVWCDFSSGRMRPLVPEQLRKLVFESVHNLAHPGIRASRRMLTSRYVWPSCAKDVATWCRQCDRCARAKVQPQEKAAVEPIPIPLQKFAHVHVDLVGPWPSSAEGHTHLMTVIDRTTRWTEAIPMQSVTAQSVADAFVRDWVARYGVPSTVTTDQGPQFTSSTWKCMCNTIGAKHVQTTAYHPQANGMVERYHRQLKEALRARGSGSGWFDHLPWALLGLRAAPKEECGLSAAEATFGISLMLPSQAHPPPRAVPAPTDKQYIPGTVKQTADVDDTANTAVYEATHVFVREGAVVGPLDATYRGPYRVVMKEKKKFLLEVGAARQWVSVDRLKPYTGGESPRVATPPRRGRPRRL